MTDSEARFLVYKVPCTRDREGNLVAGDRESMATAAMTIAKWSLMGGLYAYELGVPRLLAMTFQRPPNWQGRRSEFSRNETVHLLMCSEVPQSVAEKATQGRRGAGPWRAEPWQGGRPGWPWGR